VHFYFTWVPQKLRFPRSHKGYIYKYMLNFETHRSAPFSSTVQITVIECNDHSHIYIRNVQEKLGQNYGCWFIHHKRQSCLLVCYKDTWRTGGNAPLIHIPGTRRRCRFNFIILLPNEKEGVWRAYVYSFH
jgi:hypothetical protein